MPVGGEIIGYTNPRTMTIPIVTSATSTPLDSTTYYAGLGAGALTTTAGTCKITPPVAGTIRQIVVVIFSGTTAGSNEDWQMLLRLNNTTDYAIETIGVNTAHRTWKNTNINVPIALGDYVEIKTTTPAWATNPDGCRCYGYMVLEYE